MFSHTVGPGRNQSTSFPPEISIQLAQSRRCFCQPASRVADISVCVQKGGDCLTARRFWFLLRGRAGFSVWKSFPDDGREKKKKRRRDNMRVACLTAEPPQRPINHASYRCNEAPRIFEQQSHDSRVQPRPTRAVDNCGYKSSVRRSVSAKELVCLQEGVQLINHSQAAANETNNGQMSGADVCRRADSSKRTGRKKRNSNVNTMSKIHVALPECDVCF